MGDTLQSVKYRVRLWLDDRQAGAPGVDSAILDAAIFAEMQAIQGMGPVGEDWSTAAVTLAANDFTYTISAQIASVGGFRLASQGWLLDKKSPLELEALRTGITSSATSAGDPLAYCLIEGTAQACELRLFPTPDKVDTLDMLRVNITTSALTDDSTIALGDVALRALEKRVAASLHSDASRAKILYAEAERSLHIERCRLARLKAGSGFMPSQL